MMWLIYNVVFPIGFLLMLPHFLMRMCRRGGMPGISGNASAVRSGDEKALEEGGRIWMHAVSVGELFVAFRVMEDVRARRRARGFFSPRPPPPDMRWRKSRWRVPMSWPISPWIFPSSCAGYSIGCAGRADPDRMRVVAEPDPAGAPPEHSGAAVERTYFRAFIPGIPPHPAVYGIDLEAVRCVVRAERVRRKALDRAGRAGGPRPGIGQRQIRSDPAGRGGEEQARRMLTAAGVSSSDRILLGGSTWRGEEEILLDHYVRLRTRFPGDLSCSRARHFERGNEVVAEIEKRGLTVLRRSALKDDQPPARVGCPAGGFDRRIAQLLCLRRCDFRRQEPDRTRRAEHHRTRLLFEAHRGRTEHGEFPANHARFPEAGALIQVADAAGLYDALDSLLAPTPPVAPNWAARPDR